MIEQVWERIQPFALHPIQRTGLDEGVRQLLEHFNREDLLALWMEQYG